MSTELDNFVLPARPFYFLRHGETTSNEQDTIAGTLDVALTPRGQEQAKLAAQALRHHGITAIYSSGLRRARDTADHVARAIGVPVTIIADLAERDWGELEGKPRALRQAGVTPPGAESPDEFRRRVARALARIPPEGVPLIVAHSGVFRVLCGLLGLPQREERVANGQPVHFRPSGGANSSWLMEPV
jgi:2,3-bisphosphoglycerate-dependent phosphoglycerate mutase